MSKGKFLALGLASVLTFSFTAGSAMAAADGAKVFKKRCGSCHTVKKGKHRTGPSLAGIIGRKAGSTNFKRYKGLKGADFTWDEANLDKWLTNPKKFLGKKTTMTYKLKKEKDRKAVIAYLKGM